MKGRYYRSGWNRDGAGAARAPTRPWGVQLMPMAPRRPAGLPDTQQPTTGPTGSLEPQQTLGTRAAGSALRGIVLEPMYVTNANHIKQRQNPKKAAEGETAPLSTWAPSHRGDEPQRTELPQCVGTPGKLVWDPHRRKDNQWLGVTLGSDGA